MAPSRASFQTDDSTTPDMSHINDYSYAPSSSSYSYGVDDQRYSADYSLQQSPSAASPAMTVPLSPPPITTASPLQRGTGRSRARALSILSQTGDDCPTGMSPLVSRSQRPGMGERKHSLAAGYDDDGNEEGQAAGVGGYAFTDAAYEYALRPEEDDDDDEDMIVHPATTPDQHQRRATQRKSTFQRLEPVELWWMAGSAGVVVGLTCVAVVLSVVG